MGKTAKQIILHVGLHKTGTTAIQNTLAAANEILQSQGWKYPIFTDGVRPKINNHSNLLYTLFCDNPGAYLPNLTAGVDNEAVHRLFAEQLQMELDGPYNLILSGEDISALPEHSLRRLAQALGDCDLQVIAVVRETYSFICSHLQHRIHRGVHGIRLDVPPLQQNCARLARVFPGIRFLSYEQACRSQGGLFATFMRECSLDPTPFKVSPANVSIGNHTARFLASFNERYPLLINGKPNPERPRFDVYALDFDPLKFSLTMEEFAAIEERITAVNNELSLVTGLPIHLPQVPPLSASSSLTPTLASALLAKASALPEALMNHGFRYIADHQLAPQVWANLHAPNPARPRFSQLWRQNKVKAPKRG